MEMNGSNFQSEKWIRTAEHVEKMYKVQAQHKLINNSQYIYKLIKF